jgi:SAM-dependent methyltransferase
MNSATSFTYDEAYLSTLAGGWTKMSFPIISALVRDALRAFTPKRILDFGAGSWTYARVLSETGAEVVGCDASPACVAACEGKYASTFVIREIDELPREAFDLVFSTEVLEHIEDYRSALARLCRAVRPGGGILLTTTAYTTSIVTLVNTARDVGIGKTALMRETGRWAAGFFSAKRRDDFVRRWCFEPLGGHCHGFFRRELTAALRSSGFAVVAAGGFYAMEPLPLPDVDWRTFRSLLRQKDWPLAKQALAVILFAVGRPLNRLLKALGLFANNFYVMARRISTPQWGSGAETSLSGGAVRS